MSDFDRSLPPAEPEHKMVSEASRDDAIFREPKSLDVLRSTNAQMLPRERLYLYATVFALAPERALEIGVCEGGSTRIIDAALKDVGSGTLMSVDPCLQISPDLQDALNERVTFLEGASPDILAEAAQRAGGLFQFVLVDGDHSTQGVIEDLRGVAEVTAPGAIVLLHDAYFDPVADGINLGLQSRLPFSDSGMVSTTCHPMRQNGHLYRWGGFRLLIRTSGSVIQKPTELRSLPETNRQIPMDQSDYVIIVIGHRRPRFLSHVLESLKKQNELHRTQVWIDGHDQEPAFREKVQACTELKFKYPEAKWTTYGIHAGVHRLVLDALTENVEKFQRFIVFEDDCYPVPGAIREYLDELDRAANEGEIFSIYGCPRELPGEQDGMYRFNPWAWATTAEKLKQILPEWRALWSMPEPEYRDTIEKSLTTEIKQRLNELPQINILEVLTTRFDFCAVISFLTARDGLKHRPTSCKLAYNFGIGTDSWHFTETNERYFKPPLNMISEQDLIKKFDLPGVDWFEVRKIDYDKTYRPIVETSDCRLLVSGWSEPESWGTWTSGARASIELGCDIADGDNLELTLQVRGFISEKNPELRVTCRINNSKSVEWKFTRETWQSEKSIVVTADQWREKRPAELVFEIQEPISPKELGLSTDNRKIGLGIASIRVRRIPALEQHRESNLASFKYLTHARVKTSEGDFDIQPPAWVSNVMAHYGTWEPEETACIKQLVKDGDLVVDAGANFGWFTVVLSKCAGKNGTVLSFEPEPNSYEILLRNIELNKLRNVMALKQALSDEAGEKTLFVNNSDYGESFFEGDKARLTTHHQLKFQGRATVSSITLDELFDSQLSEHKPRPIKLMKVDCQGAELAILQGAKKSLPRVQNLLIEFEPHLRCPEFVELIKSHFNWYYRIEEGIPCSIDSIGEDLWRPVPGCVNYLFQKEIDRSQQKQQLIDRPDRHCSEVPEIDWDKIYKLTRGSSDCRLLISGWSEPESWGTWTSGERSSIELGCDIADGDNIEVTLQVRAFVCEKSPQLKVKCRINDSKTVDWTFTRQTWQCEKSIVITADEWRQRTPAQLVFEVHEPTSPQALGVSTDNRKIGLGVSSIKVSRVPAAMLMSR